jgi:hypothetical protein
MKNISLADIGESLRIMNALGGKPILGLAQAPKPYPGRKYPTRVAWEITVERFVPSKDPKELTVQFYRDEEGRPRTRAVPKLVVKHEVFSYIGKPNRYRSLEALKYMKNDGEGNGVIQWWEAEFDRGGFLRFIWGGREVLSNAFYAYHPYGTIHGIINNFTHKLYLKRIGGFSVYNYKKRFKQAEIDNYYRWYEGTFGAKLKRPRGHALIGGTVEGDA